jgi:hypothetical protein
MVSCVYPAAPIYGGAEFGLGATDEDEKLVIPDVPVTGPVDPVKKPAAAVETSEEFSSWSVFAKGSILIVIGMAVALYVRISRSNRSKEDIGYEKNLA